MIKDVLKRQTTIIAVAVIGICLCLMGVSYAIFFDIDEGNPQTVTSGSLVVQFSETKNGFITNGSTLDNPQEALPLSDDDGATSTGYAFSVTNKGSLPMDYNIYLYNDPAVKGDSLKNLDHQYIRVLLDSSDPKEAKSLNELTCEEKTLSDIGETGSDKISVCKINTNTLNIAAKSDSETPSTPHTVKIWISDQTPEESVGEIVALKLAVLGDAV